LPIWTAITVSVPIYICIRICIIGRAIAALLKEIGILIGIGVLVSIGGSVLITDRILITSRILVTSLALIHIGAITDIGILITASVLSARILIYVIIAASGILKCIIRSRISLTANGLFRRLPS